MTSNAGKQHKKTNRPIAILLLGLLLFASAGYLVSDIARGRTPAVSSQKTYKYSTEQSMQNDVRYRQSSFFSSSPGLTNTAYVADLTDSINSKLRYSFKANQATDLSYTYDAQAVVQSTYTNHNEEGSTAKNVWAKQFVLIEPATGKQHTDHLQLNPSVVIPYTKYRQLSQQFKDAIGTPLNNQIVVTLNVWVHGIVNDTPFEDRKISTITLPLDQQVYTLGAKYIRAEEHQVVAKHSAGLGDVLIRYRVAHILVLLALAVVCCVYGLRKQALITPYQRELEKIYRLHDGIIVKASRPANLNNKTVVTLQSFDDLLNLEEEIKTPIIASKVSDATTHFLITRDDIVYVYTLGYPVPFKLPTPAPTPPQDKPKKDPPDPHKQTYIGSRF